MSTTHERPRPLSQEPPDARDHPTVPVRAGRGGLFRAFWRWHFYASFLVAPVLLLLATTGLIYLFRLQLEPALHPDLMRVSTPAAGDAMTRPVADQLAAVVKAHSDADVVSVTEPKTGADPTRFSMTLPDGGARDVFVDPWTSKVLGDLDPDSILSGTAIRLHSELMVGPVGDAVIELGACWALVMALTGYYLFWRGRTARARRRAADAAGRCCARDTPSPASSLAWACCCSSSPVCHGPGSAGVGSRNWPQQVAPLCGAMTMARCPSSLGCWTSRCRAATMCRGHRARAPCPAVAARQAGVRSPRSTPRSS